MAVFIPGYGELVREYKQASGAVFSWLRQQSKEPVKGTVNENIRLATTAVSSGISMPKEILDSLSLAIDLRTRAADNHRGVGEADHGHEYIISVLQWIWSLFASQVEPPWQSDPVHSIPHQQEYFPTFPPGDYGHFNEAHLLQQR